MFIKILDTFLIQLMEKDDVIFLNDNTAYLRVKEIKAFLQKKHIKSMTWPAISPDRYLRGNVMMIIF